PSTRRRTRTASSIPTTSPTATGCCTASPAMRGRSRSTFGRGWRTGDAQAVAEEAGTMAATVEFLFDFGSPTTYLAWTQLPRICAEEGAALVYKPVLLGGIFAATGNASPATVPAKALYMGSDLARFARRYGVAFAFNPHFPINTL